jgi:hypothetical protein
LGVGIDQGDSPPSSAKREDAEGVWAESSPNKDLEVNGAVSVGDEPNRDMIKNDYTRTSVRSNNKDRKDADHIERSWRIEMRLILGASTRLDACCYRKLET